ncbi:MAG: pyruvate formate-lyase-activating protein, partial [Oscillatoria sp. Prado101]|nr:pyruvate formate-lyase-activating protein [Oscillatoria sp. Prado101]
MLTGSPISQSDRALLERCANSQPCVQVGKVWGKIHSIETCGTVDGPGLRFVIFTQGCPLHCLYCHNPDSRNCEGGKEVTADELIEEIQKYRSYMRFSGGGVTVSGGEPLRQPEFVREIFKRCKELGIHTALDTSGFARLHLVRDVLEYVDLVLLDIKSFEPATYLKVTGVALEPTVKFAQYLSEINKPVWVRFVLVPGLTDGPQNVEPLAQFVAGSSAQAGPEQHEFQSVFPLFMFGRVYALVARSTAAFARQHPVRAWWLAGTGGVFITLLLTGFVGLLRNRQVYLQQ